MTRSLLALLLALPLTALAQPPAPAGTPDEQPALSGDVTAPASEQPALKSGVAPIPAAPAAKPRKAPEMGTTIVGERESPIGLFITPWRNAFAEKDIDRPARLLQEELLPMDEDVFIRQIEYYDALAGALKQKNAVTPPVHLVPTTP